MIADLPSLQSIQLGEYALRGDTSRKKVEKDYIDYKNTVVMRSFLLCNGIMVQISLH